MDADYNDIQEWKYKDLMHVFGADPQKSGTFQVKSKREAENLFNDRKFCSAPHLQVSIELLASQSTLKVAVRRTLYAQGRCPKGIVTH